MKKEIFELIKEEIDEEYLWLMSTKHTLYDIDIAFSGVKNIVHKYIEKFFTEPWEDCVSRAELNKEVDEWIDSSECYVAKATYYLRKRIDTLPSVQPIRKSAYWIHMPYEIEYETDSRCSNCNKMIVDALHYNFCPICGADMRGDNNE